MKKLLSISLFLCFSFFLFAGNSPKNQKSPTLYQQLVSLNSQWKLFSESEGLKKVYLQLDEKELIKTHLLLVELELSNKNTNHLNQTQQRNRNKLLNELKQYAEQSVFPINTRHKVRTPYFIDDVGTACAVGQLIIKSGNKEFAQSISKAYNYSLIEDMPSAKLKDWAKEHGFTLQELKWIQPAYGPMCPVGAVVPPRCHNSYGGCMNPDWYSTNLDSASLYVESAEHNVGNGWYIDSNFYTNYWMWGEFPSGDYRIALIDSLGNRDTLFYTMPPNPPAPVINYSNLTPSATCNNSVQISITNGTPPFHISLQDSNRNNQWIVAQNGVFDSLCAGNYLVYISDSLSCFSSINITAGLASGIIEPSINSELIIPNPLANQLVWHSQNPQNGELEIYGINGQMVWNKGLSGSTEYDISQLESGVYILVLRTGNRSYRKKIIKAE